ncbi:hypothetical protein LTSEMIN_4833, partial [Salmonella enterica subsp. enterica serovar Minnesota str. A4-603]
MWSISPFRYQACKQGIATPKAMAMTGVLNTRYCRHQRIN